MRFCIVIFFSIGFFFISRSIVNYFFDTVPPVVLLDGINDGCSYAHNLPCSLVLNKKSTISLWLEDSLLIEKHVIFPSEEYRFSIPLKTMPDGPHKLSIEAVGHTFSSNKTFLERQFYVDNQPFKGSFINVENNYKVFQGRTVHVQVYLNMNSSNTPEQKSKNYCWKIFIRAILFLPNTYS